MFRNKKVSEYMAQSGFDVDPLKEKYPELFRSDYLPAIISYLIKNGKQDHPFLKAIDRETFDSQVALLSMLLGYDAIPKTESSDAQYNLIKRLEKELRDKMVAVCPAVAKLPNNVETVANFSQTYEKYGHVPADISGPALQHWQIQNELELYYVKASPFCNPTVITQILDRYPNLYLSYLLNLAIDEWEVEDGPVLMERFGIHSQFADANKGYSRVLTFHTRVLAARDGKFALSNDRLQKILNMHKQDTDSYDLLAQTVDGVLVVPDDIAYKLIDIAETHKRDILQALALNRSFSWGAKEENLVEINQVLSTAIERFLNKPKLPDRIDLKTIKHGSIKIEPSQVIINNEIYAANEDQQYYFFDSEPEIFRNIRIISYVPCTVELDNVLLKTAEERATIYLENGSTVVNHGNSHIKGNSFAPAIESRGLDSGLGITGSGTLRVGGGSYAPAIGVAGVSQSWGRWTQPRDVRSIYVEIENVTVITEDTPHKMGIGIYSDEGEIKVDVRNADTSGIEGHGAELVRICLGESGSTKMSSPLYIADIKALSEILRTRLAIDDQVKQYLTYGRPSWKLFELIEKLKVADLLPIAEELTTADANLEFTLPNDHPLYAAVLALPKLGAYMRKQQEPKVSGMNSF